MCVYVYIYNFVNMYVNFNAFTFLKSLFKRHGHHVLNTEVWHYLSDGLNYYLPKGTRKCSLWSSNVVTFLQELTPYLLAEMGRTGQTNFPRPTAFFSFL